MKTLKREEKRIKGKKERKRKLEIWKSENGEKNEGMKKSGWDNDEERKDEK